MDKIIKNLRYHYYGSIVVLATLLILVFTKQISFLVDEAIGVIAERYSIGLTLLAIPLALKMFANMIKKESGSNSEENAIKVYSKSYLIRQTIINVMAIANILMYAMSHNMNFVWLAVILIVSLIFCKPSYVDLASLTIANDKEKEDKKEEENE